MGRLQRLDPLAPHLAQLALDPVPRHGASGRSRYRDAETRLARLTVTVEHVQNEEPSRHGAAATVHGVEVARTRESVPALHRACYAERRFRPLARRRLRIAWPARVAIRARNPCLRLRRRTFGW